MKESLPAMFAFLMLSCISERACVKREPARCVLQASKPVATIQPLLSADDMCEAMVEAAEGNYG